MRRSANVLYEEVVQILLMKQYGIDSAGDKVGFWRNVPREGRAAQKEYSGSSSMNVSIGTYHDLFFSLQLIS